MSKTKGPISLWDKDLCGEIFGTIVETPEECDRRAAYKVAGALKVGINWTDIYVCGVHAKPFRDMGKTVEKIKR